MAWGHRLNNQNTSSRIDLGESEHPMLLATPPTLLRMDFSSSQKHYGFCPYKETSLTYYGQNSWRSFSLLLFSGIIGHTEIPLSLKEL